MNSDELIMNSISVQLFNTYYCYCLIKSHNWLLVVYCKGDRSCSHIGGGARWPIRRPPCLQGRAGCKRSTPGHCTRPDWSPSGMDAVRGLLVGICITLAALVHQAGGQLPLLKVLSSALAIAVVLFRVAVCQNDFQDVPAITALNCSSVTDCT